MFRRKENQTWAEVALRVRPSLPKIKKTAEGHVKVASARSDSGGDLGQRNSQPQKFGREQDGVPFVRRVRSPD